MRRITIYGSSDDLIEVEGTVKPEPDEFSPNMDKSGVIKIAHPEDGGMLVFVDYAPQNIMACWMIGIAQVDEDKPIPEWPMRWGTHERGYSIQFEVDIPDGTVITKVRPMEEEDND